MICSQNSLAHLNIDHLPANAVAMPPICELCLIFWSKYTILPRLPYCQMGSANLLCWICHNMTEDIYWEFSTAHELQSYDSKSWGCTMNHRASISYPDTIIQYSLDWLHCQKGLADMQCYICPKETHGICRRFSGVPQSWWIMQSSFIGHRNRYVALGFRCSSHSQLTNHSKLFTVSFSKFDWCHWFWL